MPSFQGTFPNTPLPIQIASGAGNQFTWGQFYGIKSFSVSGTPNANSGPMNMGWSSGSCAITIQPGSGFTMTPPHRENLNNLWFVGNSGDGYFAQIYI